MRAFLYSEYKNISKHTNYNTHKKANLFHRLYTQFQQSSSDINSTQQLNKMQIQLKVYIK